MGQQEGWTWELWGQRCPASLVIACCQVGLACSIHSQAFRCLTESGETKLWRPRGGREGILIAALNSNYLHLCYCELPDGILLCFLSAPHILWGISLRKNETYLNLHSILVPCECLVSKTPLSGKKPLRIKSNLG